MENTGKENGENKPKAAGKVEEAVPLKKETVTMTAEQLEQILEAQKQQNEMIISLNKRLDEAQKSNQGNDLLAAVRELTGNKVEVDKSKVFDPDDWDKKGVTFYYYGFMTVLSSDRRMNQEVMAPLGTIIFENLAGLSRQEGKEESILYLSGYTSHSKKEIEWIRNHTWYINGLITEKGDTTLSKKAVARSQRAAKYLGAIQGYAPSRVFQQCAEFKIDITGMETDPTACRAALVDYYVDKEVNDELDRQERILKEHGRDKHLEEVSSIA